MLSLPSFVLGLVFRFLSCVAPFWCVFVVLVFLPARLRVSFRGRRAPFCGWLDLFVSVLCLAVVGSRLLLPFPAVGPWWRPGPVSTLVPPSGYLVAFCDGLVALPYCWGCSCALSSSLHFVSWQQRPLALCGFVLPLHHDACAHWTPLSYTFAIFGSKCGILRPCPLLPSRCPLSRSCCGCVLVCCSLVPFCFFMQSPLPSLRRVTYGA